MKRLFLLILLVTARLIGAAQSMQDTAARIENIFSRYKAASPGCQLAISRNGQILFSKAWGMADLEHTVPLSTESIFEAGSVSKQFTAACILLLEQQGKLSLDDDVRKYIPELPDYGRPILIRQMIHHTSGLKDWGAIVGLAGIGEGDRVYDNDDVLDIMIRQKSLNNRPGDEFLYSNSNYNLLAIVVERVSGTDLPDFSRKYIFEPAGMKHTRWRNHFRDIVPNRAIAYGYNGDFYFTSMPNENTYGNAALLTTAEDLLTWNNYYLRGRLGTPSLLPRQLQTDKLSNGYLNPYAAGLRITTAMGYKMIGHSGSTAAYRCNLSYFPGTGLSFAWLSNTAQFDREIESINDSLFAIFLRKKPEPEQKREPGSVSLSAKQLSKDAGWFRSSRSGEALPLFVKDGKLTSLSSGPLTPIAQNHYMLGDGRKISISFSNGKKLFVIDPGVDTLLYTAVDSAQISPGTLNDYVGAYYSSEARVEFAIIVKAGKLFIQENPRDDEMLNSTYKDGFNYWRGTVYFERDGQNKITGMEISMPRARNMTFRRH